MVLLAGVLEHIPDYRRAIEEAARVAREYLIVHRCPTTSTREHERTIGTQYNIRTPRTFFAQKVLASEFADAGFGLIASIEVYPKRRTVVQRVRRTISGWRGRRHRGTEDARLPSSAVARRHVDADQPQPVPPSAMRYWPPTKPTGRSTPARTCRCTPVPSRADAQ